MNAISDINVALDAVKTRKEINDSDDEVLNRHVVGRTLYVPYS